jgi:hypothetical protein
MFGRHTTWKYRNKYIWFLTSVEEKSTLPTDGNIQMERGKVLTERIVLFNSTAKC